MARMPTTTLFEAQNPTSLKERGDKSPNCPRLSWLLTTKPVIGAAILMLIEEKKLKFDDRVSKYLPSFDAESTREITVQQLLSHTSGLPMSLILSEDLSKLGGIQATAALGGGHQLKFKPGEGFSYSDQGTDTLTALVEVVSGVPVADFVSKRILDPLGMKDSACVMSKGHPLRARASSKYSGSRGNWRRFWNPADPALFPFFLGSQGLYSTAEDYAKFMQLWLQKGRVGGQQILEPGLAQQALVPSPQTFPSPTALPDLTADYGYLMQLWLKAEGIAKGDLYAFGHSGSDGTYAWVFPKQNAMVFYFTQSRGNTTGLRIEEALGELFFGASQKQESDAPPYAQYLGYYWEGEGDLYRAIIRDGDDLALEILGKAIVPLDYLGEDRWKFRPNPAVVLHFQRAKTGEVTGYKIGEHEEFRFDPSPKLPKAIELAARVAKAHRLDLLNSIGPIRMSGELEMPKIKLKGETVQLWAAPNRYRSDGFMKGQFERLAFDGKQFWTRSSDKPVTEIKGPGAALLRASNALAYFGNWHQHYPKFEVIQRLRKRGRDIYLVRAGDTSAPAPTIYVDDKTGRVIHVDTMTYAEGMGRIGQRVNFGDFRNVSGLLLPHRMQTKLARPFIGPIMITFTKIEVGVKLPEGTFKLND